MDKCDVFLNKCREGNLPAVRNFLLEGTSPNLQNSEGDSPLQIASANGFINIVDVLLKKGAYVDLANNYGWSPLMHAARHGHTEVVSLLIQMKAKINICNRLGLRPIDVAAWCGELSCVNLLIEAGAVIDNMSSSSNQMDLCDLSSLMAASLQGHDSVLKTLLEKGSSVNQASLVTGLTPLMLAASSGYMHIVKILIEWGGDVNKTDKCGRTALDLAVSCHKKDVISYLENVTLPSSISIIGEISSDTNILHAVKSGDIVRVKTLLQQNQSLCNYLDPIDGTTPLMIASMLGHNNIIDVLTCNGADLNSQDMSNGWTPLMYAVFHRQAETVHLLLDKGAKVDTFTSNGYTALDLAIHIDSSETDIVETLTSYSASEELLESQDYFVSSPSSTIRRSHLTVEKTSARSDSQARLKEWIGGLSSHLRQFSRSSATSPSADSQIFDETLSDVFVDDCTAEKTLEGKYLSISKFYAPNQRFAHLLKEHEVEAINVPPLPCHAHLVDLVKTISPKRDRASKSKSSKPSFYSLRFPNLLKSCTRKNLSEHPNQVPKNINKFSESLDSQDIDELTVKPARVPKSSLLSQATVPKKDCSNILKTTKKATDLLQNQETLKRYPVETNDQQDSKPKNDSTVEPIAGGLTALLHQGSLIKYAQNFRNQEIDLETFQYLTEDDLDVIGVKSLESRHKFLEMIDKLKNS